MAFTKSTVTTNNISALPNKPLISATALKAAFDKYGSDDKTYVNSLIDELEATTGTSGAENIGSKTIAGVTGNTPHAQITNVKSQLDARNAENVKLTGDQTIAGIKTFTSSPIVPVATTNTQAPQKKYVDDENLKDVHLTGNQTIAGIKTFSSSPIVPTPTTDTQAANKSYIDGVASAFVLGVIPDNSLTNAKLATDIEIGSLSTLLTTIKDSVVNAINWLFNNTPKQTTATTTYYVNDSTGSDSNDGLSAGTAFKTIQYAINKLPKYLLHTCTINVAAGTYAESITISGFIGSGLISIIGAATRTNTHSIISASISQCTCSLVAIQGFDITTTTATAITINTTNYASLLYCTANGSALSQIGIFSTASHVYINDCEISNRQNGVYANFMSIVGMVSVIGTGNTIALLSYRGSVLTLYSGNTITGTTYTQTIGGIIVPQETNSGIIQQPSGTALPATTGTIAVTMDGKVKTITPTGACTFNATGGNKGDICTFRVLTSGVTSYNLTFGTNFKSQGVLATGTVTAKTFTVTFAYDGANWCEIGRTVAM